MNVFQQDGLWIINDEAHTLFANERMAEILGTTQTELVQQNSFDFTGIVGTFTVAKAEAIGVATR